MFTNAYKITSNYTQPLIVAYRFFDGTVESGLGTFIILNDEGWIMSVAHNFQASFAFHQHQEEIKQYQEKVNAINENKTLNSKQKHKALQGVKPNKKWITNFAILFGGAVVNIEESHVYGEHDIVFLRIPAHHIQDVNIFPTFKDPTNFEMGKSLCKLGYPFYPVNATFNTATNSFDLPPNLLPIPRFPIEGIYTRNLLAGKSADGTRDILFLETSTPGLKGQSGGPIFDSDGNIWAVQSSTETIELGFKGIVEINGKKVEENQFINIGRGVHGQNIVELLIKHNIKHTVVA